MIWCKGDNIISIVDVLQYQEVEEISDFWDIINERDIIPISIVGNRECTKLVGIAKNKYEKYYIIIKNEKKAKTIREITLINKDCNFVYNFNSNKCKKFGSLI